MKFIDIIRIALRMLWTNLLRSMLTILGIAVAISLIVLLIGLGYGLQNIVVGSIVQSKTLLSLDIRGSEDGRVVLNDEAINDIKAMPGVKAVSPVIVTSGQAKVDQELAAIIVTATTPEYLEMEGIELDKGRNIGDPVGEVVVSSEALELMGLTPETALYQAVHLTYTNPSNENQLIPLENLFIVGVTKPAGSPVLYLPIKSLARPDESPKYTFFKAVVSDNGVVNSVSQVLTDKGFVVDSLVETLEQAKKIFQWVTIGLGVFGTIAMVVASIGMFNTLTIALIERTREIGIMKAVGVTDKAVKKLFLAEAGFIGLLGGFAGVGLGLIIQKIIDLIFNQFAQYYQGLELQLFQFPAGFLVIMIIFPAVIALITGFYPALRAARINPLNALRYE